MRRVEGILLLAISLVFRWANCMPQYDGQDERNNPPIITPQVRNQRNKSDHQLTINTQDILEKIKEVNIKHGYLNRGIAAKNDYLHIPSFYSKQTEGVTRNPIRNVGRQLRHPLRQSFANPILDYLMKYPIHSTGINKIVRNENNERNYRHSNIVPEYVQPNSAIYQIHRLYPSDDEVTGQYIKRRVVHQQSILVPTYQSIPYYENYFPAQNVYPVYDPTGSSDFAEAEDDNDDDDDGYEGDYLENQTVDNIKNIVQHYPQESSLYQPHQSINYPQMYSTYAPAIIPNYSNERNYFFDYLNPISPLDYPQAYHARQQGPQSPFPVSEYFPVLYKNPFEMVFNTMTSMVEYGPESDHCSKNNEKRPQPQYLEISSTTRSPPTTITAKMIVKPPRNYYITTRAPPRLPKLLTRTNARRIPNKSLAYQLMSTEKGTEMTIYNSNESDTTKNNTSKGNLIIDDLSIPSVGDISFGVRLPATTSERSERVVKNAHSDLKTFNTPQWLANRVPFLGQHNGHQVIRPSYPDPIEEESSSEFEDLDSKGIFRPDQNQNKKLISRDNTGSGVFIHKLKVKKGGVAIAGPGGIATAGSGGTAIVGPNGFVYTHPDSLAIVGSGTKVVAVEPTINLSELVRNRFNGTNPRVGKVVAVGPVIYYNKGAKIPVKVTLLPFYGGAKGQTLQITETADGHIASSIINTPVSEITTDDSTSSITELEYPPLPTKHESEYGYNIKNIHRTALNIIRLQELAKKHGFSSSDREAYRANMEALNLSAHNLARIYEPDEEEEDHDYLSERAGLDSWFARKKGTTSTPKNKKDEDKRKEEEKRKEAEKKKKDDEEKKKQESKRKDEDRKKVEDRNKKEEEKKKKEEERKKKEEEEKRKQEEKKKEEEKRKEEEKEDEEDEDSVAVNLPPEDASVAEAKPVGLAVAGIGGVAASKPIATAVVGPGGLAIARPVGTAIAGVSPDQALVPIYAEGYIVPSRKGSGGKEEGKKQIHTSEYLNRIISKYHQI